jgi:hypothetical protein
MRDTDGSIISDVWADSSGRTMLTYGSEEHYAAADQRPDFGHAGTRSLVIDLVREALTDPTVHVLPVPHSVGEVTWEIRHHVDWHSAASVEWHARSRYLAGGDTEAEAVESALVVADAIVRKAETRCT